MAEAETTTEDLRQTKRELKRKLKEEMEQQEAAKKKRAALKQMRLVQFTLGIMYLIQFQNCLQVFVVTM